jgi:hypothetical protein
VTLVGFLRRASRTLVVLGAVLVLAGAVGAAFGSWSLLIPTGVGIGLYLAGAATKAALDTPGGLPGFGEEAPTVEDDATEDDDDAGRYRAAP